MVAALNAKNLSFLAVVVQNSLLVLLIRYSKTRQHTAYLSSVAVWSAEIVKICISIILEKIHLTSVQHSNRGHNHSPSLGKVAKDMFAMKPFQESIKLMIPALLYLLQNNLLFYALANLSVPTYQVTNQGKILTTAIASRIMLSKQISKMQYISLLLLTCGVAIVNLSEYHSSTTETSKEQNPILGLSAVLLSCVTSAICGVYFELIVKTNAQISVHRRNFQLAFWSFLLATGSIIMNDGQSIQQKGLFQGFDGVVLLVILLQSLGGLLVSLMLKYADAILKGFATSVAIVLSTALSILVFHVNVSFMFYIGAGMVGVSLKLYSKYPVSVSTPAYVEHYYKRLSSRGFKTSTSFILILGMMAMVATSLQGQDAMTSSSGYSKQYDFVPVKAANSKHDDITSINAAKDENDTCTALNLTEYEPVKTIGYRKIKRSFLQRFKCLFFSKCSWYTEVKSEPPPADHNQIETSIHNAGCLFFQCDKNATLCDNNNPTEYNSNKPPCCVHILRDVAREFDAEMCRIGVDYIATFGTLLGLIRSDRLIPWTGDMDYIIPSKAAANAMVHLWDTNKTGLKHVHQGINRMCMTRDFANGELAKWNVSAPDPSQTIEGQMCGDDGGALYKCGLPYVDFYVGQDHPDYKG